MAGTPEKPSYTLPEDKDSRCSLSFPNHRQHSWFNKEHVNKWPAGSERGHRAQADCRQLKMSLEDDLEDDSETRSGQKNLYLQMTHLLMAHFWNILTWRKTLPVAPSNMV